MITHFTVVPDIWLNGSGSCSAVCGGCPFAIEGKGDAQAVHTQTLRRVPEEGVASQSPNRVSGCQERDGD